MKRPFRGLRQEAPARHYDAVVLGAGIGGLVCANLLAREGMRVLLVEQHYMAGGYCSTFRRAGYTFDAASHFYPLLGNSETLTGSLMDELGVRTEWVKMDPVDTFHLPDGDRFEVPADFEEYRRRLDAIFPHQREALDRFFEAVREAYFKGLLCYFRGRPERILGEYRSMTVREALDRYLQDDKLKLLLTADCPHWGSPPERTSFAFDSMLRLSYFLGNYYPVGGSQAFADELARCFEESGGDILMSTTVERIRVVGGEVAGIEARTTRGPLKGCHTVAAGTVISNADMKLTVEQLLAPEVVDPAYLQRMEELRPSFPCFLSHLGVRGVTAEELERVQGYYWRGWNPDRVGRDALRCKVFVPTLYSPEMAPPGGQIIVLQKVQELDYEGVEDWAEQKRAVEGEVTAHLERVLPGIQRKIEVQTSASAWTSYRFTLNQKGSMLGWEMSPDQLGEGRPDIHGPVEGLYFVGHWTRPGGGITPVILSAVQVAEQVGGRRVGTTSELVAASGGRNAADPAFNFS